MSAPWWLTEGLSVGPEGLTLDGVGLVELARARGTPLYVYGTDTIRRQLQRLREVLPSRHRIFYAMKANRFGPVLEVIRSEGDIGIDACSPGEVQRALAAGFRAEQLSFNAGMLSNRDLDTLVATNVHVTLDAFSALERFAQRARRGVTIGVRINPDVALGWGGSAKLAYGKSKFGLDQEALPRFVARASALGVGIDALHVHLGWGLPASAAADFERVVRTLVGLAQQVPTVQWLNVGGGLAPRFRAEDEQLSVETWGDILRRSLAGTDLGVACEPGTFVTATAGVLLCEVTTVEHRRDATWIGLDAGHNVNVYAAHYGIPLAVVPLRAPLDAPDAWPLPLHVAGNINEANDVFARDVALPRIAEGDLVALLPAGAYGSSMASEHCLRPMAAETGA